VTVQASDLLALLNGFWQESRRADQAEARLEAKVAIGDTQELPRLN
jgi:hypothetical protein